MIPRLLAVIFLLGALSNGTAQQHARQPVKPPNTGPVSVTRSATLQIFVASDAVSVFNYLSDQGKLTAWLADQEPVKGVVTEFVPANALAFTWMRPSDEAETQVRFKLSPQGGRTLVELEQRGFSSAAALDKSVNSWVFYLQNLKSVIENQVDLRQAATKAPARSPTRSRTR